MFSISSRISMDRVSSSSVYGSNYTGTVDVTMHRDNDTVEVKLTPAQARKMIVELRKAIKNASKPSK